MQLLLEFFITSMWLQHLCTMLLALLGVVVMKQFSCICIVK